MELIKTYILQYHKLLNFLYYYIHISAIIAKRKESNSEIKLYLPCFVYFYWAAFQNRPMGIII